MNNFIDKVYKYIINNNLINKKDIIITAVSGGADSMALLLSLIKLKDFLDIDIYVCHVNHMLRADDAKKDADFVADFCKKNSIEYTIFEENISDFAKENKLSLEEAGRNIRYLKFEELSKYLSKTKQRNTKIALAHNKNDSVETVLMNLCRGTGLLGLSGIKAKRDNIIRPLLNISRAEIEAFLKSENISHRTDKSNFENIYTRNIIRNKILPILKEDINTLALDNIIRSTQFISEADTYIKKQADKIISKAYIYDDNNILHAMNVDKLKKEDKIIRSYVIRDFISNISKQLKDIEKTHIDLVDKLIFMETGKFLYLPYNIKLKKSYSEIRLINNIDSYNLEERFETKLLNNRDFVNDLLKNQDFEYTKYLDYDKIKGGLEFRTRKQGDYIRLNIGKKSLKSFMIDKKIPSEKRNSIMLVCSGNEVIWIPSYRFNESFKASENSTNILKIIYKKG